MAKFIILIVTFAALALGILIFGLFLIQNPFELQNKRADITREADLQKIRTEINKYFQKEKKLPSSLAELSNQTKGLSITDPRTKKEYGYQIGEGSGYKLCANFASEINMDKTIPTFNPTSTTTHGKGDYCFEFNGMSDSGYVWPESKTYTITDKKLSSIRLGQVFDINDPKIQSVTTSAQSYYSEVRSTEPKYSAKANFPDGFFSHNSEEWGFITTTPAPVKVTLTFKQPTKLKSISSDFTPGCGDLPCLEWSVVGVNTNNYSINLFKGYGGKEYAIPDKAAINVPDEFKQIEISVSVTSSTKIGFLYWKKIYLEYN